MAQIVCYREGRVGFHIGDVVEIGDDVEQIDTTYFRRVTGDEIEQANAQRAAIEAEAKAEHDALEADAQRLAEEAKLAQDALDAANHEQNAGE